MARDNENGSDSTDKVGWRFVRPNDPWPIDPYVESGINLADHLNELVDALDSTNFVGTSSSRPAYAVVGTMWCKQEASGKFSLYIYNGNTDLLVADSDGVGIDEINISELIEYLNENFDIGVKSFTGADGAKRSGDVVAQDGDYKITLMGDYGSPDGTYTNQYAVVANGSQFMLQQIVNSFTGSNGDKRYGDVVASENDYKIDMLGDVEIANIKKDEILIWDGTEWGNTAIPLLEAELQFMGGADPTQPAPANPSNGDIYLANIQGAAHPSWTGISGMTVQIGNAIGWSEKNARWYLLGDVFQATIERIDAGSGISVGGTASVPVISINRSVVDTWYAAKSHGHSEYALVGHDHDGVYSPINHNHSGVYEPAFTKNSAFNKNFGGTGAANTVARSDHTHSGYALTGHTHSEYADKNHGHNEYEPKFTKKTAFNKNFGSGYNDVARGDHDHGDTVVGPHTHTLGDIKGGTTNTTNPFVYNVGVECKKALNVSGGAFTVAAYISCTGYIYSGTVLRSGGDVIAYYSSDENLKDNIRQIDSVLDKVCQIRSIEFEWNDKQDDFSGTDVGVSAQSVQAVFPSLVKEREKDGHLGVRYEKLVGPAIGAIAELRDMVTALQSEVAELKAQLRDQ
jgi:hypothetical protein